MDRIRRPSSPEKIQFEPFKPRSRESSAEKDIPGYMKPLDRSLRPKSPHLENINRMHDNVAISSTTSTQETEIKTTKFGVTLKRTDSDKQNFERRKSSAVVTEELEIEEIFDLTALEQLLEKVTSYDIRRRIRAQIRLVKRLIAENKHEIHLKKTIKTEKKQKSPEKVLQKTRGESGITEYQSKYTRKESPVRKPIDNKLYMHSNISNGYETEKITEYKSSYDERRRSDEYIRRSVSPDFKVCFAFE